jgi:hypothetical protein
MAAASSQGRWSVAAAMPMVKVDESAWGEALEAVAQ